MPILTPQFTSAINKLKAYAATDRVPFEMSDTLLDLVYKEVMQVFRMIKGNNDTQGQFKKRII